MLRMVGVANVWVGVGEPSVCWFLQTYRPALAPPFDYGFGYGRILPYLTGNGSGNGHDNFADSGNGVSSCLQHA